METFLFTDMLRHRLEEMPKPREKPPKKKKKKHQAAWNLHQEQKYLELAFYFWVQENTVDGRNPAPHGMYKNPANSGISYLSTGYI